MELPKEVWNYILQFAAPRDLSAFELSCKAFKTFANVRWKSIVKESLIEAEITDDTDVKLIYKNVNECLRNNQMSTISSFSFTEDDWLKSHDEIVIGCPLCNFPEQSECGKLVTKCDICKSSGFSTIRIDHSFLCKCYSCGKYTIPIKCNYCPRIISQCRACISCKKISITSNKQGCECENVFAYCEWCRETCEICGNSNKCPDCRKTCFVHFVVTCKECYYNCEQ